MADVTRILEQIEQDAKREEERILSEANAQVQAVLSQAEQDAQAAYAREMEQAEKAVEQAQNRLDSAVSTEQKKALLQEKQHLLDDAFCKAIGQLNDLPQEAFMAYVEKKLQETSLKGEGKLIVPQKYKVGFLNLIALNAKLKGLRVSVAEEDRGITGGFILVCGLIEENYTFDAQVQALRDELTGPVADILFAG